MAGKERKMPEVIYPKEYIEKLEKEIEETKQKIKTCEQPIFDTVDDMFAYLEKEK